MHTSARGLVKRDDGERNKKEAGERRGKRRVRESESRSATRSRFEILMQHEASLKFAALPSYSIFNRFNIRLDALS